MNERKLLVDTDTKHTMSSGLQHSEGFASLTPFGGKIKIEHFFFLRWLVNFDGHCISSLPFLLFIDNEKRFFLVRQNCLSQPTARQSQVAISASATNIDNDQTDQEQIKPIEPTKKTDKKDTNCAKK